MYIHTYSIHYMADGSPAYDTITKYEESHNGQNPDTGYHYPKGECWDLQPWQALDYSRQRVGLPNGDYDRERHQRQLVEAILTKAFAQGLGADTAKVQGIITALGKSLVDIGGRTPLEYAYALRNLTAAGITMVGLPGGGVTSGGTYRGEALKPEGTAYSRERRALTGNVLEYVDPAADQRLWVGQWTREGAGDVSYFR